MKKIVLVLLLLVSVLLLGCQQPQQNIEISSDQGDVEITATGFDNDEWCQEGAEWTMSSTTDEGDANAQWIIKGLQTSGEYSGLCHVEYTAQTPQGESVVNYYFSEDGESGYFEMNVNGQTIKQEWHS